MPDPTPPVEPQDPAPPSPPSGTPQPPEPTPEPPTPEPPNSQDTIEPDPDPEPVEPLTLESLTLPEGMSGEDPMVGKFLELINSEDPKEQANGLLTLYNEALEVNAKAWLDLNASWQEELRADAEVGGDKLDPALGKVSGVINEYAKEAAEKANPTGGDEAKAAAAKEIGEALRTALDLTGAGNNPAITKFLIWTSSQLGEGAPLSGGSTSGGELTRAQKLFGNQAAA